MPQQTTSTRILVHSLIRSKIIGFRDYLEVVSLSISLGSGSKKTHGDQVSKHRRCSFRYSSMEMSRFMRQEAGVLSVIITQQLHFTDTCVPLFNVLLRTVSTNAIENPYIFFFHLETCTEKNSVPNPSVPTASKRI